MTNLELRRENTGLTVYYIPPYDGKTTVTAFKPVIIFLPPASRLL
jgi:hypothetical protein